MAAAAWADLKQMLHTCGMLNDVVVPNNVATRFAAMYNITSADDLAVFEPKDVENMIKLWNQDPEESSSVDLLGGESPSMQPSG
jgi:hypothetical protein